MKSARRFVTDLVRLEVAVYAAARTGMDRHGPTWTGRTLVVLTTDVGDGVVS